MTLNKNPQFVVLSQYLVSTLLQVSLSSREHVHHGVPTRREAREALPRGDHLQHKAGDPGSGGPEERAQLDPAQPAGDHQVPKEG